MIKNSEIRWEQRFQNFSKSFMHFENAIAIDNPDITQKAGIIQFFEMSFELSWKCMKDYLFEEGFLEIKSPRDAIKKAFEVGLITDGEEWIKALVDRNLTSHTYEEDVANEIDVLIRTRYFFLLESFKKTMQGKL